MSVVLFERGIEDEAPEYKFGETYFSHMIPPFKPEHTLILGYGTGTVADLMRKIWGLGLKITALDVRGHQKQDAFMECKMELSDALDYVHECTKGILKKRFDYIAVDLWEEGNVPDFVFTPEFASMLGEMAKGKICFNVQASDTKLLKVYEDYAGFTGDRISIVGSNSVSWWSAK